MRKLLLSIAALFFMAGLVVAAEVTLVKYDKDKKEVTVKDGDKEKTYKITDATKFTFTTKDGDKDGKFEQVEKMLSLLDGRLGLAAFLPGQGQILDQGVRGEADPQVVEAEGQATGKFPGQALLLLREAAGAEGAEEKDAEAPVAENQGKGPDGFRSHGFDVHRAFAGAPGPLELDEVDLVRRPVGSPFLV